MTRVLFVCIENSCRSQMAEAFAYIYGKGKLEPYSSGSRPSGAVNPKAIAAMKELDYDLSTHYSKGLEEIPQGGYAYVINMGCGDACPDIETENREDWDLPDPKEMQPNDFNKIRDKIESEVKNLIGSLPPPQ